MDFFDLATNHVSIRKFRKSPIDDGQLQRVLACGLRSSSSGNMQSWSVIKSTALEWRSSSLNISAFRAKSGFGF